MNYSTTYTAVIVNLLSFILPHLGVTVGSDELTITIQAIITGITGVWILIQRYKQGGITIAGTRKA